MKFVGSGFEVLIELYKYLLERIRILQIHFYKGLGKLNDTTMLLHNTSLLLKSTVVEFIVCKDVAGFIIIIILL